MVGDGACHFRRYSQTVELWLCKISCINFGFGDYVLKVSKMPSTGLSLNVFALFQKIVNATTTTTTTTATATTTEILKPLVSKLTLKIKCGR